MAKEKAQFERNKDGNQLKSLEEALKVTNAQIIAAQKENIRLLDENSSLTAQRETKEQELKDVILQLTEAQQSKVAAEEEVEKLIVQKAELEQSLEALNAENVKVKTENEFISASIEELKAEKADLDAKMAAKKEELEQANQTPARIAELEKNLAAALANSAAVNAAFLKVIELRKERNDASTLSKALFTHPTLVETVKLEQEHIARMKATAAVATEAVTANSVAGNTSEVAQVVNNNNNNHSAGQSSVSEDATGVLPAVEEAEKLTGEVVAPVVSEEHEKEKKKAAELVAQ